MAPPQRIYGRYSSGWNRKDEDGQGDNIPIGEAMRE
jgi:hypothetical protein